MAIRVKKTFMSNSCVIHGNSCLKKNHLCPIPVHSCPFLLKQKTFTCPSTYLCLLHARAKTKTLHSLHLLPPAQSQIFVRGPGTVCPRPADCQYQAQGRFFGTRLESPSVSPSKTIHYSLFISEAPLRCSECSVFVLARA